MQSSFFGKRQSKRELCFADSRRGQEASQLRTSPLAGWSILWTRACTIFPPPVLYGGPTTSTARSRLRSDRRIEAASAGRCWWSAALARGLLRLPILLGAWPSQARSGRRSSLESLLLLGVDERMELPTHGDKARPGRGRCPFKEVEPRAAECDLEHRSSPRGGSGTAAARIAPSLCRRGWRSPSRPLLPQPLELPAEPARGDHRVSCSPSARRALPAHGRSRRTIESHACSRRSRGPEGRPP